MRNEARRLLRIAMLPFAVLIPVAIGSGAPAPGEPPTCSPPAAVREPERTFLVVTVRGLPPVYIESYETEAECAAKLDRLRGIPSFIDREAPPGVRVHCEARA